jgi:hypothetical protein
MARARRQHSVVIRMQGERRVIGRTSSYQITVERIYLLSPNTALPLAAAAMPPRERRRASRASRSVYSIT